MPLDKGWRQEFASQARGKTTKIWSFQTLFTWSRRMQPCSFQNFQSLTKFVSRKRPNKKNDFIDGAPSGQNPLANFVYCYSAAPYVRFDTKLIYWDFRNRWKVDCPDDWRSSGGWFNLESRLPIGQMSLSQMPTALLKLQNSLLELSSLKPFRFLI